MCICPRFIERNCIIIQRIAIKETRRSFNDDCWGGKYVQEARRLFFFRFNAQLSHKCTLHDTLLMIISSSSDKGGICVLTSCITRETDEREAK